MVLAGDTAGWPSCQYSTEQLPTFRVYPRVCGGTLKFSQGSEAAQGRCCMIQLRREWGRFSNFSFRTPQRRISAYPARPSG